MDTPNNVANSWSIVKGVEDPVLILLDRVDTLHFIIIIHRQEPKDSPASRRSESLEVHIGDIKEKRKEL
ncbi:hypothetical protein TNCV_533481 [Trichonephila clavipes]|nr:hypothetical protein TNCV_533481 [Trichonephila clavipes]